MAQHLISCRACGGLSPTTAAVCLHCDEALARRVRFRSQLWRMLAGGGFMMTLAACYGVAYRQGLDYPRTVDADADGSPAGLDCADEDPSRFPGAADPDGDGIDQNCDGVDGWRDPAVMAAPEAGGAPGDTAPAPAPAPAPGATPIAVDPPSSTPP